MKKIRLFISTRKASYGYILIGYLSVLFNILLSLTLMRKLDITTFGKVSIGRTIFQSFEFSHLGIRNGFDRLLPETNDEVYKLRIFWSGFKTTAFFSFIFCLFWFIFYSKDAVFFSYFIFSGLIYSLLQLYRVYFRTYDNKLIFFQVSLVSLLVPSLVQIVFFNLLGIPGLLYSFLISYVFALSFVILKYGIRTTSLKTFFKDEIKKLFSNGFLLFLTSLFSFCVTSGDRILLEKFWGLKLVGEYSIVMFVFSTMALFPVNYTELIMSQIVKTKSLKYVNKHIFILIVISLSMCVLAIVLIPIVFKYLLPKYLYLSNSMMLITFACIPYSGMSILNYYLHATDNRIYIVLTSLISAVAYFSVLMFILYYDRNLNHLLLIKIGYYLLSIVLLFYFSFKVKRKLDLLSLMSTKL